VSRPLRLIAAPAHWTRRGEGRTTFYAGIKDGLITPPLATSARSKRWPDYEADVLIAARIAGLTDDEIRALVIKLEAARPQLLSRLQIARGAIVEDVT